MTNKDLNLALDQNLIQLSSKQTDQDEQQIHDLDTANLESITGFTQDYQSQPNKNQAEPPSIFKAWLDAIQKNTALWLSIALLLILLLLAGLWLTNRGNQSAADSFESASSTNSAIGENQDQIEALNNQVLSLQQQVEQLKLSLHEQQSLIATSSKDLNKEIQALTHQLQVSNTTATSKPTPIEAIPDKAIPSKENTSATPKKTTNNWYVNIGTFASKKSAQRLQNQLSALGHSAQISTTSYENKPAYRVQLPGFKDRETAELAARQVMEKTNLNGLWAWKEE